MCPSNNVTVELSGDCTYQSDNMLPNMNQCVATAGRKNVSFATIRVFDDDKTTKDCYVTGLGGDMIERVALVGLTETLGFDSPT